jgi:hypothetical protein
MTIKTPKGNGAVERKGSYRPVEHAAGPMSLDQGPNDGRETPRMTKPFPYAKPDMFDAGPLGDVSRDGGILSGLKPSKKPPLKRRETY